MSTSAHTIGRIDYALRRRFAFAAIEADESKVSPIASKLFNDLKAVVEKNLASEFEFDDPMVGHSYFIAENKDKKIIRRCLGHIKVILLV